MGLEHLEKLHKMVVQDQLRLSESNDESLGVHRLGLAWRSLERRSHTTGSGRISLERQEFRLSEPNDESQILVRLALAWGSLGVRLAFAWHSLERAGKILNWAQKGVARLSDGMARLSECSSGQNFKLRFSKP